MGIEFAFLIYLTLFRLAIIAAVVISIVLGYQLFCRGVWPRHGGQHGTDVTVEVAESRFTLKNAAPGTCFALFGVIIVSIMLAQGGPKLVLETLQEGGLVQRKTMLRGNG